MTKVEEVWVPVPSYEQFYSVSNKGRIKRLERPSRNCCGECVYEEKILSNWADKNGYRKICFRGPNKVRQKTFLVHRIVALAFIPNPNNHPEINHLDGVKWNNDSSNLEWTTRQGNMDHCKSMGLRKPQTRFRTRKIERI